MGIDPTTNKTAPTSNHQCNQIPPNHIQIHVELPPSTCTNQNHRVIQHSTMKAFVYLFLVLQAS
jgi:hypothetical protein